MKKPKIPPSPRREGFFNLLTRESERGTALIVGEACNERLGMMLGRLFVEDTEPHLLRHALGTFSSRIEICFALGLISPDERDDLRLVARIRNSAAHFTGGSNQFSFSEDATANACRSLRATSPSFMREVERDLGLRGQFIGKFIGLFNALDARMQIITRRDVAT